MTLSIIDTDHNAPHNKDATINIMTLSIRVNSDDTESNIMLSGVYANRQIHPIMLIVIVLSVITLSVVVPFMPGQNVYSWSSYIFF